MDLAQAFSRVEWAGSGFDLKVAARLGNFVIVLPSSHRTPETAARRFAFTGHDTVVTHGQHAFPLPVVAGKLAIGAVVLFFHRIAHTQFWPNGPEGLYQKRTAVSGLLRFKFFRMHTLHSFRCTCASIVGAADKKAFE